MTEKEIPCPGESDVTLININGRIYRKNKVIIKQHKPLKMKNSDDRMEDIEDGEEPTSIQFDNNKYKLVIKIPKVIHGLLIGKGNVTKNKIQRDTNTIITFPPLDTESDDIIINGDNEKGILDAKQRLELIMFSGIEKLPPTHFISIPLTASLQISDKLKTFQKQVFETCADSRGVDPSIFVTAPQFHLTIIMLKLYNSEQKQAAINLLKESEGILYDMVETRSVVLSLRGLEIMNDDASQADILYAKVLDDDNKRRLTKLCKYLIDKCNEKGIVASQDEQKNLKLHATLMNTKFRDERNKEDKKCTRKFTIF